MSPAFLRLPRGRPGRRAGAGGGGRCGGGQGSGWECAALAGAGRELGGGGREAGRWQVCLSGRQGGGEEGRTRSALGTEDFLQSAW